MSLNFPEHVTRVESLQSAGNGLDLKEVELFEFPSGNDKKIGSHPTADERLHDIL